MNEYVTERELKAHLEPIKADIWEMKADLKLLVLASARQKGAAEEESRRSAWRSKVSDRRLAYVAIFTGVLAPVAWLHIF